MKNEMTIQCLCGADTEGYGQYICMNYPLCLQDIEFRGQNYAAWKMENGIEKFFQGEEAYGIRGKVFAGGDLMAFWKFKLICPSCGAEGDKLKHSNWYMSKEAGEALIVECMVCGFVVNTEDQENFDKWKVGL